MGSWAPGMGLGKNSQGDYAIQAPARRLPLAELAAGPLYVSLMDRCGQKLSAANAKDALMRMREENKRGERGKRGGMIEE